MDRRSFLGAGASLLAMPAIIPAARAQSAAVKVAFVATLSGPAAALGVQLRDGWAAGVKHLGGKLGGLPVETLVIDDELKPETALTRVRAALDRDKVDFVVGVVFSNMLQAIFRPVTENETFLVTANAGPSTYAGRGCSPYFFTTAYQNDQPHATMGQVAQDFGYKRVFVLVPNYQAGKDAAAGFRSRFKGEVVDEVYVPLNQLDFANEVAKIAALKPDAVFTFMPGGLGVALVRQYRQAGLADIPFLSTFTVDEATLPAQREAALGFYTAATWAPDFANAQSQRFVQDFMADYNYVPGNYAAQAYDAASMIDSAVKAVGGKLSDKAGLRAAMEKADFTSLRGNFRVGRNHYPVQDFYLCKVVQRPDGKFATSTVRKVLSDDVDPYAGECRMRAT
ncbi:ABC transporter substrate-binding protein [Pseudoroseomonas deserti]|uniref:ABC transporter substrate-binding protein n=1 Tax=Teichococcus deserti TaxID=1817963 RepID=A0A1V2H2G5_9PROT|nr:ABC transporter substrate-binding protein [Pseudoroseomonas deserti]ONG52752.1 ABC transporter substrate-binding protein [Pseudoroseomonas deserti]